MVIFVSCRVDLLMFARSLEIVSLFLGIDVSDN